MREDLGTVFKLRHQGSSQPSSHSKTTLLNQESRPAAGKQMESCHMKLQTQGLFKTTCQEGIWHICRNTKLWFHLPPRPHTPATPKAGFQPYHTNYSQTIINPGSNVPFMSMTTSFYQSLTSVTEPVFLPLRALSAVQCFLATRDF